MERHEVAALLAAHAPADDEERAHVAAVQALLATDAPFSRRQMVPGHLTCSAFVVSPDGADLLLIHHGRLGRWLQPGGHVEDADRDVLAAALREVAEETGVGDPVPLWDGLLDVDVHDIPAHPGRGELAHQHLDLRVALRARSRDVAAGSDARGVRWVPIASFHARAADGTLPTDRSVLRAVERLRARLGIGPAA